MLNRIRPALPLVGNARLAVLTAQHSSHQQLRGVRQCRGCCAVMSLHKGDIVLPCSHLLSEPFSASLSAGVELLSAGVKFPSLSAAFLGHLVRVEGVCGLWPAPGCLLGSAAPSASLRGFALQHEQLIFLANINCGTDTQRDDLLT